VLATVNTAQLNLNRSLLAAACLRYGAHAYLVQAWDVRDTIAGCIGAVLPASAASVERGTGVVDAMA
jgi:hypothetical protein